MKKPFLILSFLFIVAGALAIPPCSFAQTAGQTEDTPADTDAAEPAQDQPSGGNETSVPAEDGDSSDPAGTDDDEGTPESTGDDDDGAADADADTEVDEDDDFNAPEDDELPAEGGESPARMKEKAPENRPGAAVPAAAAPAHRGGFFCRPERTVARAGAGT